VYVVVVGPVKHLFLHGPHFVGCWRGLPAADVCSGLTGVHAAFWHDHGAQCEDVIDRHAWSFAVLLYVSLYFGGMAWALLHTPRWVGALWRTLTARRGAQ
jgi:hypothetical protein